MVALAATPANAGFDSQHFIRVEMRIFHDAQELNSAAQQHRHADSDRFDLIFEQGRIDGALDIIGRLQAECD
jgi:hypothetical protein